MKWSCKILMAALCAPGMMYAQNIGINTTGASANPLNMLEILQLSTTANSVALFSEHSGALAGGDMGYALKAIKSGATGINVAGYFSATGGGSNYSIIVPSGGGNVGIGTETPDSKAILDLTSTTQGVFFPRMTTAQRNAITAVPTGLMIYNTTTNCLEIYSGTAWLSSCSGFSNSNGNSCTVVAGTASASTTSGVCGVTTALKLSGFTGSSFQWQRSSDNSVFVDISGATTAYYSSAIINSSTTTSASEYFRCKVSDGTCVTFSNTITLTNTCASNSWCQKMNFPGTGRYGAFSFTIGTKGYIGCGYTSVTVYRNDFWQYDPTLDLWTQMADFGGQARAHAAGFAVGTKGYAGGGETTASATLQDFYEYDPATNIWTAKANMPDTRSQGVGVSDGTSGYLATGHDNGVAGGSTAVYKYNVGANTWSTATSIPTALLYAVAFSIGTNIYIGTGANMNCCGATASAVLYKSTDGGSSWSTMTPIPVARWGAFAFGTSGKGYVGSGTNGSTNYTTFYEYDEAGDTWTLKAAHPISWNFATGFAVNGLGYSTAGNPTGTSGSMLNVFQYFP